MKLSDRLAQAQQRPTDPDRQSGGAHRVAQRERELMTLAAPHDAAALADEVVTPLSIAPRVMTVVPDGPVSLAPAAPLAPVAPVAPVEVVASAADEAAAPAPATAPTTAGRQAAPATSPTGPTGPSAPSRSRSTAAGATKRNSRRPAKTVAPRADAAKPAIAAVPASPTDTDTVTDTAAGAAAGAESAITAHGAAESAPLNWVTISSATPPVPAAPAPVVPAVPVVPVTRAAPVPPVTAVAAPAPSGPADRLVALPTVPQAPAPTGERVRYVDPLAGIKRKVHQSLLDALGPTLYDAQVDERELAVRVRQTLQQVMESEQALISTAERVRITNEVSDEILGHGPLEPFLRDPEVTEIMVNGADQIYVERKGKIYPVNAAFTDNNHLRRTIEKIVGRVGRRVDESSPMVDARLLDGSRVNAVLPPVALDGPMLTIRKFAADPLTVNDIVEFGTITAATANLLAACVRGKLNILISGGTGSGKTTLLNVLSSFVPSNERIVTIEDAAELQLRQDHVVRMESRPSNIEGRGEITTRDLVRNALRMRPDRIIVGEVRDGAAVDMLQAMNTGHDGSLTTLHANSPRDALSRLETMVLMAGVELPTRAIREQAASAINLIVHQSRLRDGTRRVTHITEVTGMESEVVTMQDLFLFDHSAGVDANGRVLGTLRPTGIRPMFVQRLAEDGIVLPPALFQEWS